MQKTRCLHTALGNERKICFLPRQPTSECVDPEERQTPIKLRDRHSNGEEEISDHGVESVEIGSKRGAFRSQSSPLSMTVAWIWSAESSSQSSLLRLYGGGSADQKFSRGDFPVMRLRGGLRLFTHNILISPVYGIEARAHRCCLKISDLKVPLSLQVTYPLGIIATSVAVCPCDFNPDFVRRVFARLDWVVLLKVFHQLGVCRRPEQGVSAHLLLCLRRYIYIYIYHFVTCWHVFAQEEQLPWGCRRPCLKTPGTPGGAASRAERRSVADMCGQAGQAA